MRCLHSFMVWFENSGLSYDYWDVWAEHGCLNPVHQPYLAHTHAPRDWSDDNHGWGEWGDCA